MSKMHCHDHKTILITRKLIFKYTNNSFNYTKYIQHEL